MVKVIFLRR